MPGSPQAREVNSTCRLAGVKERDRPPRAVQADTPPASGGCDGGPPLRARVTGGNTTPRARPPRLRRSRMTTHRRPHPSAAGRPDGRPAPAAPPSPRGGPATASAWLVTAAHTWILVGLFLDGWFHIHGAGRSETLLHPLARRPVQRRAASTVLVHLHEVRAAPAGRRPGYAPSLAGGARRAGSPASSTAPGTPPSASRPTSRRCCRPPHLLLITAGTLVFAGPLRAALRAGRGAPGGLPDRGRGGLRRHRARLLHPVRQPLHPALPDGRSSRGGHDAPVAVELREVAGVAGVVVCAALLVGGAVAVAARPHRAACRARWPSSVAVPHAVPGHAAGHVRAACRPSCSPRCSSSSPAGRLSPALAGR